MIENGRVAVDRQIAQLGDKADPETQRITVDGVPIQMPRAYTYVMLNKPRGYLSTTSDPEGRRTVMDLVELPQRLYPVGRLDYESEGLILLTDDGELTQHLTHPRYGHARVYSVLVSGEPTAETLDRWRRGITLDGKRAHFDSVEVAEQEHGQTWLRITVYEGRRHLVRRIVAALGHPARRLIRVEMGPIQLGSLPSGRWRYLTPKEIDALRKEVGIARAKARPLRTARSRRRPEPRSPSRQRRPPSQSKRSRR
jgi:pseudouridine synthase